jgi:hypothetical protein
MKTDNRLNKYKEHQEQICIQVKQSKFPLISYIEQIFRYSRGFQFFPEKTFFCVQSQKIAKYMFKNSLFDADYRTIGNLHEGRNGR